MTTAPEPWNPTPDADGHITLPEAVGQALGTASACWSNLDEAGEFNDVQCREVHDGLMAYISDWADEQRKQANEATAAKMGIVVVDPLRMALAYALHLRQHGERAPGGDETWAEFDRMAERLLREALAADTEVS